MPVRPKRTTRLPRVGEELPWDPQGLERPQIALRLPQPPATQAEEDARALTQDRCLALDAARASLDPGCAAIICQGDGWCARSERPEGPFGVEELDLDEEYDEEDDEEEDDEEDLVPPPNLPCQFCLEISQNDPRSSEAILREMVHKRTRGAH